MNCNVVLTLLGLNLAAGVQFAVDQYTGFEFAVDPELTPKSDKKFFGKDYPDDKRPTANDHFSHPFPEVQDDHHYDKDYVKDKNDDGGAWHAQMSYDTARVKVST